jgi:hypothetical protein
MKPKYYTRLTQYDAFIGFSRKHDSVLKKLRGFSLNCMQLLCWSATNKTQYAIITVNWQQYALLVNGSGPGVMAVPCWSATNKILPLSHHPVYKKPTSFFYNNGWINYWLKRIIC